MASPDRLKKILDDASEEAGRWPEWKRSADVREQLEKLRRSQPEQPASKPEPEAE